jgi:hypothetical protein
MTELLFQVEQFFPFAGFHLVQEGESTTSLQLVPALECGILPTLITYVFVLFELTSGPLFSSTRAHCKRHQPL